MRGISLLISSEDGILLEINGEKNNPYVTTRIIYGNIDKLSDLIIPSIIPITENIEEPKYNAYSIIPTIFFFLQIIFISIISNANEYKIVISIYLSSQAPNSINISTYNSHNLLYFFMFK